MAFLSIFSPFILFPISVGDFITRLRPAILSSVLFQSGKLSRQALEHTGPEPQLDLELISGADL